MGELLLDALAPAAAELVRYDVAAGRVTRIVRDGEVVAFIVPAGSAEDREALPRGPLPES